MTRSTVSPLGRLLVALALTLAAVLGSAGVATAASADDDDRSSSSQSSSYDDDEDDAAEKAAKAAEKAAEEARKAAEKAAEQAAEEVAKNPAPIVVEYGDGDVIDRLGTAVKATAPQLSARYDAVAPLLRNLLSSHLTKKGATVTTDSRGKLVIAPYLCDEKKLTILQPGCVTVMPTAGGPRF